MSERHVLGISGGRDSAALAVYMRQTVPELDIEYFFTDTGKELPEVYEFLGRLEGFLGKPILRLNPDRDFDFWLQEYKNFLPSPQTRWCTKQLKIKPFEAWLRPALANGERINSYVAIRSDEDYREGYVSGQDNLRIHLPFREAGVDKAGVMEILEAAGVGLPEYYRWRSRSGCTFCFYQQKIEWARLLEEHPEAFEEAKRYEKNALEHGSPFTWSHGGSLVELARPERLAQIRADHEKRVQRLKARRPINSLSDDGLTEIEEIYGSAKLCVTCHK
jgi:3'-phosphoadenosine 5'-phosphosulfate sulfotransferase (PAPS reductase)/FAD synthetase